MTFDLKYCTKDEKNYLFITEVIQRGRPRPAKYRHEVIMPHKLYNELVWKGIFDPEFYFVNQLAFFAFKDDQAIISFINFFQCEDLHLKAMEYLIIKLNGENPIKRIGYSKC